MSCKVCKPLLQGEKWRTELKSGHSEQSVIALSCVMGTFSLIIYPKPYKPHKFWSTQINHCPYCGEFLNPDHEADPEFIQEERI